MNTIGLTTRDVARELARRYSTMTHDELDVLESILMPMKFQKGDYILREGEVCTNIYWVVKGLVRQYYIKNGKELTEYMAAENTIFMSIESLFKEQPSHQTIHALEPTIVFALPKDKLERVAVKNTNIQMLYRKILEESLILAAFRVGSGALCEICETCAATGAACTVGVYCQLSADDTRDAEPRAYVGIARG